MTFFRIVKRKMSKFQSSRSRPLPTICENNFERGITTRIMAKKHISQMEKESEEAGQSSRNSLSSRRNSRFLSGTSIPNSTIRLNLELGNTNNKDSVDKKDSHHSYKRSTHSIIENNFVKQRQLAQERGLERLRNQIRSSSLKMERSRNKSEDSKRYSAITALYPNFPITRARRSTLESIRNAIDKVPNNSNKLINVDSIERKATNQYLKPSKTESSLIFKAEEKDIPTRKDVQKKDLQTQTSIPIEKLLKQLNFN